MRYEDWVKNYKEILDDGNEWLKTSIEQCALLAWINIRLYVEQDFYLGFLSPIFQVFISFMPFHTVPRKYHRKENSIVEIEWWMKYYWTFRERRRYIEFSRNRYCWNFKLPWITREIFIRVEAFEKSSCVYKWILYLIQEKTILK